MKNPFPVALLLALAAVSGHATILFSDQFSYTNGPLVGAMFSPWQVHSGSGAVLVTNQQLEVTFARGEDVNAPLTGAPYDTTNNPTVTTLYASFKVKFVALPSGSGAYFAHFRDGGNGFRCRVWASTNGTSTGGRIRLGIANSSSSDATTAPHPIELVMDATYTVVTRFDVASGACTLWLDPSVESDFSVTAGDAVTSTLVTTSYAFRQAAGVGTTRIDDLKVGTTFNDVAGPNSPPSISTIAPQRLPANTPSAPIAFTVGDSESPVASLTVSGTSSATTLIPNANLVFGGSGADRTIIVTPAPGEQGTATITISVGDLDGGVSITSFTVGVGLPTISDIPNQLTAIDTATPAISFTVGDSETAAGALTVTASSSNTGIIPSENVVFGGSDANRTATITPAAAVAGFSVITVTVSDGVVTTTDSFILTVFPVFGVAVSDDFSRADGMIVDGSGRWQSHSGAFQETRLQSGALKLLGSQSEDISTVLAGGPYPAASGAILYCAFKVNFTELPSAAGGYFAHFKDDGTANFRCRVSAFTAGAAPNSFRLGVANNATAASAVFPLDLQLNTPYIVVTRFITSTGVSSLWVNPADANSAHVTATDSPSTLSASTYAFRQSAGIGTLCVDDLRVAGNFSDTLGVRLRITGTGSDVTVSWPIAAAGFSLQFRDAFGGADWAPVLDSPFELDGRFVIPFNGTTGTRFFRLIQPPPQP